MRAILGDTLEIMNLHERQQFDFLLQTAAERLVARLEERHRGPDAALARLRADTAAEIDPFVGAIFSDFLLDNAAGACFVLQSLARRSPGDIPPAATVEELLVATAKRLFTGLLAGKTEELLEQHSGYQSV
ncbi:MAG: hypothetical protein RLZZ440_2981 [Planctomycetota bacterium]